jgi:Leucine-rich repeat (LRR) protein
MARDAAYREAEQKIEAARRSGATELDLRNMELTELPDSLWQLTALQSLDLSYNKLAALPEALGQLSALQSLVLGENQLTALPEALGQLTALQTLYLLDNKLTALPEIIGTTQTQKQPSQPRTGRGIRARAGCGHGLSARQSRGR